jgi:hypothetical protein
MWLGMHHTQLPKTKQIKKLSYETGNSCQNHTAKDSACTVSDLYFGSKLQFSCSRKNKLHFFFLAAND